MTDEEADVVLRLLREIRAERSTFHGRITTIHRHMEDVKESVGHALGLSAHANVAYETTGRRRDRMEEIPGLTRRAETLENGR